MLWFYIVVYVAIYIPKCFSSPPDQGISACVFIVSLFCVCVGIFDLLSSIDWNWDKIISCKMCKLLNFHYLLWVAPLDPLGHNTPSPSPPTPSCLVSLLRGLKIGRLWWPWNPVFKYKTSGKYKIQNPWRKPDMGNFVDYKRQVTY